MGTHDRNEIGGRAGDAGKGDDLGADAVAALVVYPFHRPQVLQGASEASNRALGKFGPVGHLGDPQLTRHQNLEYAKGPVHGLYARHLV